VETIALTKFKATCHAVIERVRVFREPVLVTKRGKPLILVSPVPDPGTPEEIRNNPKIVEAHLGEPC